MSEAAPAASSPATSPPSPRRSPADISGSMTSTDDTNGDTSSPSSSKDGEEDPMSPDATPGRDDDDVPNMETIDRMLSYLEDRCSDWTLAQDDQLATALFHISWYVRRRTREVAGAVSSLEDRAEKISISVDSTSNELIHRADVQFIENRVSDDDDEDDEVVVDDGSSRSRSRRRHRPATSVSSAAGPPSTADGRASRVGGGGGTARTGGTGTGTGTIAGGPETDDESSIRRWREEVEARALMDGMRALPLFVDPATAAAAGADRDRRTVVEDSPHYYETAEADVFNCRPLPFIIGSPEFAASNDCGLGPPPPQPTRPPPEPEPEQEQEQVQESEPEPGSRGGAIVEDGSGGGDGIDNERGATEDGGGDEAPGSSDDAVESGADTRSS